MPWKLWLIPREESLFALFEQQAQVLLDCLPILAAMAKAESVDPHWASAMQAIEQRGDRLTSSIIQKTEQTFITPLDREDLLALAVAVDDVLDFIEEFAIKVVDYQMAPDAELKSFFELVALAVGYVADGLGCLRQLQSLDVPRTKMKECEHRADELVRALIRDSYEIAIAADAQDDAQAVTVGDLRRLFRLYVAKRQRREIAELAEAAVDACERVFHVLRNIYLKEL
jgi:uncharacterized protein Yka (UPF0111/DUF47 family)